MNKRMNTPSAACLPHSLCVSRKSHSYFTQTWWVIDESVMCELGATKLSFLKYKFGNLCLSSYLALSLFKRTRMCLYSRQSNGMDSNRLQTMRRIIWWIVIRNARSSMNPLLSVTANLWMLHCHSNREFAFYLNRNIEKHSHFIHDFLWPSHSHFIHHLLF